MDAFSNLTVTHEHALGELQDTFRTLYANEGQHQHRLITAIQHLHKYVNHIDELRQSIEFSLQEILTPQVVSKVTLRTTLLGIKSEIQERFPWSQTYTLCIISIFVAITIISLSFYKCPLHYRTISFRFSRSPPSPFTWPARLHIRPYRRTYHDTMSLQSP